MDQIIAEARHREKTYREQALKMYPWICARCGREFTGKKLRELTVHHKDHDHDNNPPDGSNWELLCLYCHDNEHQRYLDEKWHDKALPEDEQEPPSTFKAFAGLDALLKKNK
ncbi:MAG: YajD family HNH nuclease [Thermodesulfobacteriota bacterium]|nr:YajD family HNH nuclease [Thermodesulfobacteriota bacterium]